MGHFILNSLGFSSLHTTNIIGSTSNASHLHFEMFCEYSPGAPLGFMWLPCLKAIVFLQNFTKNLEEFTLCTKVLSYGDLFATIMPIAMM